MHVHKAVIHAKEFESGITIHYVNGAYDEGDIIRQFRVSISNETSETLSTKVRALEHKYFSDTVAELVLLARTKRLLSKNFSEMPTIFKRVVEGAGNSYTFGSSNQQ